MHPAAENNPWIERRIRERIPVSWNAKLVFEGGSEACKVIDFSPRGARVSATNKAPINRRLSLRLTQHGEFVGRIVWRRPESMGLRFQHLDDALARLVKRVAKDRGPDAADFEDFFWFGHIPLVPLSIGSTNH